MIQAIKQRFIQALESGFYVQTDTSLKDDRGYCALGVLCDLYSMETGIPWVAKFIREFPYYSIDGRSTIIPESVRQWSGIEREIEDNLMGMNDSNISFTKIANYLKSV